MFVIFQMQFEMQLKVARDVPGGPVRLGLHVPRAEVLGLTLFRKVDPACHN